MNKHTVEYKAIPSKGSTKNKEQATEDVPIKFKEQLELESEKELRNYPNHYAYAINITNRLKYKDNLDKLKAQDHNTLDLEEELSAQDFDDARLYHTEFIQESLKEYVELFIDKYTEELLDLTLNELTQHLVYSCKCNIIYLNKYKEYLLLNMKNNKQ